MSEPASQEGGCRCGALRFRVSGDPVLTAVCHCTGCQRMTGGAYSLTTTYPEDAFEVTAGEPVLGGMKADIRHHHCPQCLSWVFTTADQIGPLVNVRTTMFDQPSQEMPFIEVCTSEALAFAVIGAPHGFEQFPAMEQYQPLLAEFAATRGK